MYKIKRRKKRMKIDFTQEVKNLKGEAFKQGDITASLMKLLSEKKESYTSAEIVKCINDATAITLGNCCIDALSASFEGEKLSKEDKIKRGRLCEKIFDGKEIEIKDASLCQDLIAKYYTNPILVMRANDMLENATEK
jgi:hypothetical protein